jgi:hypothetical protein
MFESSFESIFEKKNFKVWQKNQIYFKKKHLKRNRNGRLKAMKTILKLLVEFLIFLRLVDD